MEDKRFQQFLLETAICSMACDGDIDDREVAELQKLSKHTQYFKDINIAEHLKILLQEIQSESRAYLRRYFKYIETNSLSNIQELLVLEIILRIIYADERLDDNEIRFLKLVRSKLKVHDEIIHHRFGDTPIYTANRITACSADKILPDKTVIADKIELVAADYSSFQSIVDTFIEKEIVLELDGNNTDKSP